MLVVIEVSTMNIGACHPRRCLPLVVVNLALLSRHVVTSQQDWLLRAILPPEYDAQRVPLEQDDDLLTVQGTIHLKHFDVGDDQRVSEPSSVQFHYSCTPPLVSLSLDCQIITVSVTPSFSRCTLI